MEAKNFLLSKTFWVNVLAFVASMFGIQELVSPEFQAEIVATVMAIVNIVLRFLTKKPIKFI